MSSIRIHPIAQYVKGTVVFRLGNRVKKMPGGDYTFEGVLVGIFQKRSGVLRCVVEDDRGCCHIFNIEQLEHA